MTPKMKRFVCIIIVSVLAGCTPPAVKKSSQQVSAPSQGSTSILNMDPCAARLHDISGQFLLYYAVHHQLPQRIEQLQQMAGPNDVMEFVCPETLAAYIYNPQGLIVGSSRIVLYDGAPAHNGVRWAVSINQPTGNAALVAEVVGVPEARFAAPPSRP